MKEKLDPIIDALQRNYKGYYFVGPGDDESNLENPSL